MHTGRVNVGYLGIGLVLVLGIAVVVYGWLADRTDTKRRQDALTQAPDRPIPGLRDDAPSPRYVSQADALRNPHANATPLPEQGRTDLQRRMAGSPSLPFGFADPVFVTDAASGLCVLDHPLVLVADDPVTTTRELLGLLERATSAGRAVVVVAPSFELAVIATLAVNSAQETLDSVAVVVPDNSQRRTLCSLVGAALVPREDLRAGYLPDAALGTCDIWVCDGARLWVLNAEKADESLK